MYLYDSPGSLTGTFSALTRKFKLRLERRDPNSSSSSNIPSPTTQAACSSAASDASSVDKCGVDYTGKQLKIETLASVEDLERYMHIMVGFDNCVCDVMIIMSFFND